MQSPRSDRPTGLDGPEGPLTVHRSTAILGMTVAIAILGGLLALATAHPVASTIGAAVLVTLGGFRALLATERVAAVDRPATDEGECGTCERA